MLNKKICVIVGDAAGKGSDLAETYAEKRYQIALMDTDKESGNSLKKKVEQKYGRKVFFFHGDAGSEEDLELFAGAVIGQYKKVDCLYYRTDMADKAGKIVDLLRKNLKRGGVVEEFF